MNVLALSLIASLSVILAACGEHGVETQLSVDTNSPGIIYGSVISERTTAASKSVVLLRLLDKDNDPIAICTGTIVSSNVVLTAGHCLHPSEVPDLVKVEIGFGNKYFDLNLEKRDTLSWIIHPQYNTPVGNYENDLALISFNGKLPAGFAPVELDSDLRANYAGQTVHVYGYGRTLDYYGKSEESAFVSAGTLHKGELVVDASYNKFKSRYFTRAQSRNYICQGDSGGPQFLHQNGKLKLIGVNSATYGPLLPNGKNSCRGLAQATKVAPAFEWIQAQQKILQQNATTEFSETSPAH